MAIQPLYWTADVPTYCEISMQQIIDCFVGGVTPMGSWGHMHPDTHSDFGCGFGLGRGQKYEKQPDGRWLKTKG